MENKNLITLWKDKNGHPVKGFKKGDFLKATKDKKQAISEHFKYLAACDFLLAKTLQDKAVEADTRGQKRLKEAKLVLEKPDSRDRLTAKMEAHQKIADDIRKKLEND